MNNVNVIFVQASSKSSHCRSFDINCVRREISQWCPRVASASAQHSWTTSAPRKVVSTKGGRHQLSQIKKKTKFLKYHYHIVSLYATVQVLTHSFGLLRKTFRPCHCAVSECNAFSRSAVIRIPAGLCVVLPWICWLAHAQLLWFKPHCMTCNIL